MKTILTKALFLVVAVSIFYSCNQNGVRNQALPSITGSAGELLVVIDKNEWQSQLGDTIRYFFGGQVPMTMAEEPYFDLSQIMDQNFNSLFNCHRSILIVSIKPESKENVTVREDVYASPQIIVYVSAPSKQAMINLIAAQGEAIRNKFILKEIDRWSKIFEHSMNVNIANNLKKVHNYSVSVPNGFKLDVNKKDFFWISQETADYNLGIISWDYPYTSKDQLTLENLIKKRNEVLKANLPGPVEKSYMTTEDLIPPISNEIVYKGRYFFQINGLWKLEGAFMGGPFVSYTTVDDARKRLITVEGFVFSPRKGKRNFLRQLEGILFTLDVTKDQAK